VRASLDLAPDQTCDLTAHAANTSDGHGTSVGWCLTERAWTDAAVLPQPITFYQDTGSAWIPSRQGGAGGHAIGLHMVLCSSLPRV
jgi:hypothetical protein